MNYLRKLHSSDTSSFSVNHQQQEGEEESLLRYGHSKDKRPDLLQYRQLLATLDPAGIPLVSATLAGNGADDPLYWPTWQRMFKVIGHNSFVFLADCKAAAIVTRGQIAATGGIYCFPVPMSGQHPMLLKQWVLDPPSPSVEIRLPRQDAEEPAVGRGFEVELGKFWLKERNREMGARFLSAIWLSTPIAWLLLLYVVKSSGFTKLKLHWTNWLVNPEMIWNVLIRRWRLSSSVTVSASSFQ